MRIFILLLALPIVLSACSRAPVNHSDEWNALKSRCLAESFEACAEIGHAAQQSETVPSF